MKSCIVGVGLVLCIVAAAVAQSPKPLAEFENTRGGALAVAKDGKRLAVGADYKGPLELFNLVDRNRVATLESVEGTYVSVDFSPDGKLLAVVRVTLDPPENNLSVWNIATKKRLWETKEGVAWARFSPDGKRVAAGKFGSVRFFEPRTGKLLQDLPIGSEAYVGQGEYAAGAKLFVTSGDEDRRVTIWNAATGRVANSIKLGGDEISGLALSDDGALVAVAQQGQIAVYETRSGKQKWSKKPSDEAIRSIDFRPRSQQVATAGQDGTARVWEGATGTELRLIEPEHGMVQAVRYTPDGSELIVGSSGATSVYAAYDLVESAEDRVWRSEAGNFTIEAKLIGKDGDSVYLMRKSDRKQILVPLSRLSEADRSYVETAMKRPAEPLNLSYGLVEDTWETGEEPLEQGSPADVLSLLAEVAGDFSSPTTSVEVGIEGDQWRISGKTEGAFAFAKSYTIENLQPRLFTDKIQTFSWSAGQPPVKMLRKDEGLCFLSGISGAFHGYGEEVRVHLVKDATDGLEYWVLEGTSGQPQVSGKAVALRWRQPEATDFIVEEVSWKNGDSAKTLLPLGDGLCFLGSLSGCFAGGGERVGISSEDDKWVLSGQSGQAELSARALVVRIQLKK